ALKAAIPDDFWREMREEGLVAVEAPLPIDSKKPMLAKAVAIIDIPAPPETVWNLIGVLARSRIGCLTFRKVNLPMAVECGISPLPKAKPSWKSLRGSMISRVVTAIRYFRLHSRSLDTCRHCGYERPMVAIPQK